METSNITYLNRIRKTRSEYIKRKLRYPLTRKNRNGKQKFLDEFLILAPLRKKEQKQLKLNN